MLVHLLIRLSALSLGLSHVVCTTPQQTSQLATLHERMNQMLSALYSSPLLSKVKASSSDEAPAASPESTFSYPSAPAPQVVYVSPPSYPEGSQPNEFAYSLASPVPRPTYSFDYYQQQFPPVYSPPRQYPEYLRYPQLPAPQPVSYPSFAPPTYPPFSSVQYPRPAPFGYQPGYPAPGLPSPFLNQVSYPPMSLQGSVSQPLYPSYPAPALPSPCPPPTLPSPYSSPAMPSPYTSLSHLAQSPYSPPVPFPSMPVPYLPSHLYSQAMYPAFPKPSDIPQPQYEYSS